jgi:hypothetical protein
VHKYALPRLPPQRDTPKAERHEPDFAMVTAGSTSGLIEID